MAAELTYRTIFALVPVVVLGLVMFRIVGGLDEIQNTVENQLYSFFGVPEIPEEYLQPRVEPAETLDVAPPEKGTPQAAVAAAEPNGEPPQGDSVSADVTGQVVDMDEAISLSQQTERTEAEVVEETRREARASIRRTLHEVTTKVASINFKSIGVFGLLLFIYAAIALADSTEHLFNRIYDAPSQRPIHIRVAIHWSIITLGSGLLAMSLYMSGQVVDWFVTLGVGSTSRVILSHLLAIGASWVLLFLLYALMPNTHVSVRAAAIGSLVGALLWEAAKSGFQIYVVKAVPYSAIYGSIGLIPLFLFWVYVTWLIFLFGLILTYTLQTFRGRLPSSNGRGDHVLPSGDPDWMLPIMCEVGHAFEAGNPINHQELADRIGLSSRVVHDMTSKLVDAEMLLRVTAAAGGEDAMTLARPAEKISVGEILGLAHRVRPTNDHPAWKTLADLKKAERDAAEGKTLADVQAW
jgi:membrane protein